MTPQGFVLLGSKGVRDSVTGVVESHAPIERLGALIVLVHLQRQLVVPTFAGPPLDFEQQGFGQAFAPQERRHVDAQQKCPAVLDPSPHDPYPSTGVVHRGESTRQRRTGFGGSPQPVVVRLPRRSIESLAEGHRRICQHLEAKRTERPPRLGRDRNDTKRHEVDSRESEGRYGLTAHLWRPRRSHCKTKGDTHY